VVVAKKHAWRETEYIADLIAMNSVTCVWSVPTQLQEALERHKFSRGSFQLSLRNISVGGEAFPLTLA
jgi:non-ribosomal peptide synthetase component F